MHSAAALVLLLPASLAARGEQPHLLFSYDLAEAYRTVTPAGTTERAIAGSVRVIKEDGRLDLVRGTLPRSSVTTVIGSWRGLTLVDRGAKVAAAATSSVLRALFRAPRGSNEGLSGVRAGEVEVETGSASRVAPFEGWPAQRRVLSFAYTLTVTVAEGVRKTRVTGSATIDTIEEPAAAWPALDDLRRLFDVPAEVEERLAKAPEGVSGLPVAVTVETRTEVTGEKRGKGASPGATSRPPSATTKAARRLSRLSIREATVEDRDVFLLPDDVRTVGIERLVAGE